MSAVEPFRISAPTRALDDLVERLARTRWPDDFANDDWSYGASTTYIQELAAYWRDEYNVSVRARGVISGVGDGVFRGGACPTPECGVAGGHRVHRYGGVCTLQP